MATRAIAKIETERVIVKKMRIKLSTRNPQKEALNLQINIRDLYKAGKGRKSSFTQYLFHKNNIFAPANIYLLT